mmetsp:Transcript_62890/g.159199  ORF Transcript_62890/g.159199 Transcript_62890/m.159199 type:complete len:228 (-) Transcript_62890:184-867(-)
MDKQRLAQTYDKMTHILKAFEDRFNKMLGASDSWFSVQVVRAKAWLANNPEIVAGIVGGTALVGGAAFALSQVPVGGHCLIYYIIHGCSYSFGACASAAIFTGIGFAVGACALLVVGLSVKVYDYTYASEDASKEVKDVNAMVRQMESMPDKDLMQALDDLLELTNHTWPAELPDPDDRKCVICLGTESEVETPVRAPRCGGKHFMCKACWVHTLSVHGDKCPVCRM